MNHYAAPAFPVGKWWKQHTWTTLSHYHRAVPHTTDKIFSHFVAAATPEKAHALGTIQTSFPNMTKQLTPKEHLERIGYKFIRTETQGGVDAHYFILTHSPELSESVILYKNADGQEEIVHMQHTTVIHTPVQWATFVWGKEPVNA